MFKFLCLIAFASCACAASIGNVDVTTEKKEIIPLLRYEAVKDPNGSFHFSYEGGDRSSRDESGKIENAGTDEETLEVVGSYRYIDADGQEVEVHYTAGKNGFVPIGTNIPSEISALAKAAADLPDEQPLESEIKRRARAQIEKKELENIPVKIVTEVEPEKVQTVVEDKKPVKA